MTSEAQKKELAETRKRIAKILKDEREKPSMLPAVIQAAVWAATLSAISNVLAQALASYRHQKPFVIDWVPVAQFYVFNFLNTPPNFAWQTFLENTFPAFDEPESVKPKKGELPKSHEPKLNVQNTLIKTLMDQTLGAVINTFLFATFTYSVQAAMSARNETPIYAGAENSIKFLLSGNAVDFGRVDMNVILEIVSQNFNKIIVAGWKLWPAVSIVNFAFVKTVEMRGVVTSFAGMGWGIYVSLFAAGEA